MSGSINISSATSLAAATMVTQNYAALSSNVQTIGVDPTAGTIAGESQSSTLAQFSLGVLKKSLDIQASAGAQLIQTINQGPGVDIQA